LGVFQLRVHFLLVLQIHPVRILYTLDIVFWLVILLFMNTFPTCTPNLSNQNTVYIGYSIPIGCFSTTSTFPTYTPNSSSQNIVYIGYSIPIGYFFIYEYISYLYSKIIQSEYNIGYSILIGYFSLYYYISYLYSKIIQSEHCIYWMQCPGWLFQVPCTVEPV
jgi:hypothetical protein